MPKGETPLPQKQMTIYTFANAALFAPAPGTIITTAERDAINAANAASRPAPTDFTADELFAAMFN